MLRGAVRAGALLARGDSGRRLRIHASGHTLRHLLPPWLRRLQGQRPDIEVALYEAKVPAVSLVRSGEANLLVDHLPEVPADLEAQQVGKTRAFLVLPSNPVMIWSAAPLRTNLTRFHGVFAPGAKVRPFLLPQSGAEPGLEEESGPTTCVGPARRRAESLQVTTD